MSVAAEPHDPHHHLRMFTDHRWALGAADAAGETPSAVTRDTQLETGARLKFLVEPLSPVSVTPKM